MLHEHFIIRPEEIPENYFQNIIKRHEEEGRPIEEIPQNIKNELTETLIKDQTDSLDLWVDYLTSNDAKYPDWLKYWAFRNILVMGRYDKEKKRFTERSKSGKSVSPFPDLNREALSFVFDAMEKNKASQSTVLPYDIQPDERAEFQQCLDRGNFTRLYAWAIEKINPITEEMLKVTEGEWRKFPKGSDYLELASSLANYGTGWCIRGESTARRYLEENDLEIYYSRDENGELKIPRVVIVTDQNNRISEVRGVAEQENIDPYIGEVVDKKLADLPDGKAYDKRSADMKFLTSIKNRVTAGEQLTKDELIFLYEINAPIENFGYQKDPRIAEIRATRDPKKDASLVFGCQPEEIAWSQNEINQNAKAYIGPLFSGIFTTLSHLEHLYIDFPDGKISRAEIKTEGKTGAQLEKELADKKINFLENVRFILQSPEFTISHAGETIPTIRLKVRDLFSDIAIHTYDQIVARAKEYGLDILPHEVGPGLLLQETSQPKLNERWSIVMSPIADRRGDPRVFHLAHDGGGLWLWGTWAGPADKWNPDYELMFRVRNVSPES